MVDGCGSCRSRRFLRCLECSSWSRLRRRVGELVAGWVSSLAVMSATSFWRASTGSGAAESADSCASPSANVSVSSLSCEGGREGGRREGVRE